ncbi:MAG: hypothetical protein QXW71_02150 [Thermoplasmata archaeon]
MLLVEKSVFYGTIKVYLVDDKYIVEFIFDTDWYTTVVKRIDEKKWEVADFGIKSVSYWVNTLKEMEELVEKVSERCLEAKRQIGELKRAIEERLEEVFDKVVDKKKGEA